jgi:hypothetical protein
MNAFIATRRIATAALLSLTVLAAPASAEGSPASESGPMVVASGSTLTRAEVVAELFASRADGSIRVYSNTYNPLAVAKSVKSRDAVRAEVVNQHAAERSGLVATAVDTSGEDSGSFALARLLDARVAPQLLAQR